jgi:hypothetical protein
MHELSAPPLKYRFFPSGFLWPQMVVTHARNLASGQACYVSCPHRPNHPILRPEYLCGYVMPCVGNLTEEKSLYIQQYLQCDVPRDRRPWVAHFSTNIHEIYDILVYMYVCK